MSYQSSSSVTDIERSPLVIHKERLDPTEKSSSSVRRTPRNVRWIVPVIALMVVLLFVSTSYMPSEEEMSLAHENDVSILTGGLQQMRSAQFIADSSFLTGHKHHKKIFTEVRGDAPEGCEATVVIIRHCEKGSIREHCSYPGFERSVYLATLFGDDGERWPAPSQIFALSPGRHKKMNFREMELVSFYVSPFLYLLARP
jgi:hypothetical protein